MDILSLLKFSLAILAPAAALGMVIFSLIRVKGLEGKSPEQEQVCLRCQQLRSGAMGQFSYSAIIGKKRHDSAIRQIFQYNSLVLATETHFICDHCTHRHLSMEILQIAIMMLPYTIYLYVLPYLSSSGMRSNYLIEGFLMIFALGGLAAVFDLSRAVKTGETPLAEMRDRIALKIRKPEIGRQYNYYTRIGTIRLESNH